MIHYRTFRNTDPPLVADVWNATQTGTRTVQVPPKATGLLEFFTLAKPYFDRDGLLLAFDDTTPVGFVHAGFAGAADGKSLDRTKGVVCSLGVQPKYRRRGIGSELLKRAEEYLRAKGATDLLAGPCAPDNPFTFGLYGGANSPGFLASDSAARPFFEHHGYQVARTQAVYQRGLKRMQPPTDPRFLGIHPSYDILGAPYTKVGWWKECVLGPVEAVEYRLQDKQTSKPVARIVLWDMATFSFGWGETSVGMLDMFVEEPRRRQGLAKYLLVQVLMHLHHQTFDRFETCVDADNAAAAGLLQGLGFEQVDTGHCFRRG